MSQQHNPAQLNLQALAAAHGRVVGRLERSSDGDQLDTLFSRLASESCVPHGLAHVSWRVQAELRDAADADPQVWLQLEASAAIPMICQRCLNPVVVQVTSQQAFRFVADEATAEIEDDASEEDVLVLTPRFNLLALVEDELIMSVPLVPMHDACPEPVVTQVADTDFVDAPADRIHPFADLRQKLKPTGR